MFASIPFALDQSSSHHTFRMINYVRRQTQQSLPNEYDVLLSMLSANPVVWPEQIMIEIHWATRMVDVKWMLRTRQAAEISLLFGTLFNVGGYIPVYRRLFPECHPCAEVLLVRAVC